MMSHKRLVISSNYYKQIFSLLNSIDGHSRLIGGCVRDAIIDKPNFDIDIATTLLPEQVVSILSTQSNITVVPIGIAFGTVSAFIGDERFEITTLRKDINCDGRHAQVEFCVDFEQDALRRDFTINALSYCPLTETIYDYFNGIQDLLNKKVIFIGEPQQRIKEDYLRILRFFRFSCNYAKQIDRNGLNACIEFKEKLSNLSKERVKSEMDRIISYNNAPHILRQMYDHGILQYIFPWQLDYGTLAKANQFAHNVNITLTNNIKYSILFHNQYSLTDEHLLSLKFSKQDSRKILGLIAQIKESQHAAPYYILKRLWIEYDDYLGCITAISSIWRTYDHIAKEFIAKYASTKKPIFPVTGNDLLNAGITGEEVGRSLRILKSAWIENDFIMTKQQLLSSITTSN